MQFDLAKQQVLKIGYGLLSLIITAVIGAVLSVLTGPEFQALVTENLGDGPVAAILFLIVNQAVAWIRNAAVLSKYTEALGSTEEREPPVLI